MSLEDVATNCKSNVGCWNVQSEAMHMSISLAPLLEKKSLSFAKVMRHLRLTWRRFAAL